MKLILDFDDVLFDTKTFKRKIFSGLERFGIGNEIVEKQYAENRNMFNLENFYFDVIEGLRISVDEEKLKESVNEVMDDLSSYANIKLINTIKEVGEENCFILTAGNDDFQNLKIKLSGIGDFFPKDKIIIVDDNKNEHIKSICDLYKSESIIFVDDKEKYIKNAEMLGIPNLQPILYSDDNFENLNETINFFRLRDSEMKKEIELPMR